MAIPLTYHIWYVQYKMRHCLWWRSNSFFGLYYISLDFFSFTGDWTRRRFDNMWLWSDCIDNSGQRALTVGRSLTLQLASSLTCKETVALLHTNNNIFPCLVESRIQSNRRPAIKLSVMCLSLFSQTIVSLRTISWMSLPLCLIYYLSNFMAVILTLALEITS